MLDKILRLTWLKVVLIATAWVICVVLHNAVYAMFHDYFAPNGDEPFFFLLAVIVIPLYATMALVYTVASFIYRQFTAGN